MAVTAEYARESRYAQAVRQLRGGAANDCPYIVPNLPQHLLLERVRCAMVNPELYYRVNLAVPQSPRMFELIYPHEIGSFVPFDIILITQPKYTFGLSLHMTGGGDRRCDYIGTTDARGCFGLRSLADGHTQRVSVGIIPSLTEASLYLLPQEIYAGARVYKQAAARLHSVGNGV